jgi:thiamine pyrophosphokinase
LPLTKSINISLTGFVYNLNHKTIIRGQSRGISNQISKTKAKITLHSGKALVIKSKD